MFTVHFFYCIEKSHLKKQHCNCVILHQTAITFIISRSQIQPTTLKSRLNCSKNRPARMWGWIVLKADEKSTKKESSMRPTSLQVFQKWVEQSDRGILYTPMWPVGKLHGIKYMLSFSYDLWPYQSLDIFHYYWCKSHWSKIIEGFWTTRFGDGDYHSILPDFRDMLCHILSGHVLLLTFVEWKTFKMSFCDSWKCCLSLSLKPSSWTSLHTSHSDECWLAAFNSRQSLNIWTWAKVSRCKSTWTRSPVTGKSENQTLSLAKNSPDSRLYVDFVLNRVAPSCLVWMHSYN